MGAEEAMGVTWGTWEELLLGGAVLRHGTGDWDTVAAELRARALCPYTFTAQVCRVKYEDLQRRYSGCTAWFDELRKKRMEELRHALEVSDDSIGSLESKLETLKSESGGETGIKYGSSQTQSSPVESQKSEDLELLSKESKDGLSAGSFTVECEAPPAHETETKPEISRHSLVAATLKKPRGQRKRKECGKEVKESSFGESGFLDSVKENSTTDCPEVSGSSVLDHNPIRDPKRDEIDTLLKVFNAVVEHKSASTFRHRLDSQKRGRYKKMIRKHVDFHALKLRIMSRSIVSVDELFRDLLLLANNALVFYSKSTREHKSAMILRDLVTKTLRQHHRCVSKAKPVAAPVKATARFTPVKPRSSQAQSGKKNWPIVKAPKRGSAQPRRVTQEQTASPAKARKRNRTK